MRRKGVGGVGGRSGAGLFSSGLLKESIVPRLFEEYRLKTTTVKKRVWIITEIVQIVVSAGNDTCEGIFALFSF